MPRLFDELSKPAGGANAQEVIRKTPDVCGGEACIRGTRITVRGLVEWRKLGLADTAILGRVHGLTSIDLEAAWRYYAQNTREIDRLIDEDAAA